MWKTKGRNRRQLTMLMFELLLSGWKSIHSLCACLRHECFVVLTSIWKDERRQNPSRLSSSYWINSALGGKKKIFCYISRRLDAPQPAEPLCTCQKRYTLTDVLLESLIRLIWVGMKKYCSCKRCQWKKLADERLCVGVEKAAPTIIR